MPDGFATDGAPMGTDKDNREVATAAKNWGRFVADAWNIRTIVRVAERVGSVMPSMFKKKPAKRSPIRDEPLPQAGDSLRLQEDLIYQKAITWILHAAAAFGLIVFTWYHYLFNVPLYPWHMTILAGGYIAFAMWRAFRLLPQLRAIRLGITGERSMGQQLETLRAKSYRVFHDLEEDGFNIDHALIGPGGVFAVETKTRSKNGTQEVVYDGERLTVAGHTPDRDPLVQAKATARRLREILKQQTGQDVRVKPIVVFPGWFVTTTAKNPDVYVCNDKFFLGSFEQGREHAKHVLEPQEIAVLASGLERHLRRKV